MRVIFYAGHGVQVKGRNYLLPVDTEIRAEDEVPTKSADLNELLDRLSTLKNGINMVILDACRNNPFSGVEIVGPDGRRLKFRGATPSGLARVEAPLGTMVAFSTAPDGVALDNPQEKNSLFAKHLLATDAGARPAGGNPVQARAPGRGRRDQPHAGAVGKLQPDRRLLLPHDGRWRLQQRTLRARSLQIGRRHVRCASPGPALTSRAPFTWR